MKKIKLAMAVSVLAVGAVLFTACKKTEGPQGPAGPQGPSGVVTTSTDGYIKGTLSGAHRDGTVINETFNFANFWGSAAATLDSSSFGGFTFDVSRGTDILSNANARIQINTASLTNLSSANGSLDFTFEKSLGINKMFEFSTNTLTPTLSGVAYNATTGLLTGNFTATSSAVDNNTGHTATISGSFQTTVTKLYYRMAHH